MTKPVNTRRAFLCIKEYSCFEQSLCIFSLLHWNKLLFFSFSACLPVVMCVCDHPPVFMSYSNFSHPLWRRTFQASLSRLYFVLNIWSPLSLPCFKTALCKLVFFSYPCGESHSLALLPRDSLSAHQRHIRKLYLVYLYNLLFAAVQHEGVRVAICWRGV